MKTTRNLFSYLAPLGLSLLVVACSDTDLGFPTADDPPPPSVPVSTTASFDATGGTPFMSGEPPYATTFSGGSQDGGAWSIPEAANENIGLAALTTPARMLNMTWTNNYTATAARSKKASEPARAAKQDCGVDDPGGDNRANLGALVYVRGLTQVDDPGTPATAGSRFATIAGVGGNEFFSFSDSEMQAEFEVAADNIAGGMYQYKVADGGWLSEWSNDTQDTVLGASITLPGGASAGAPNSRITISETGCYNWKLDTSDQANLVLTVTKVEDDTDPGPGPGPGPGPEPDTGGEITVFDVDGQVIGTFDTEGTIELEVSGSDPAIGSVQVNNRGGQGNVGVTDFSWGSISEDVPEQRSVDIRFHKADAVYDGVQIEIDDGSGNLQTVDCAADPSPGATGFCGASISVYPSTVFTYRILDNGVEDPAGAITVNVNDITSDNTVITYASSRGWFNAPVASTGDGETAISVGADEILLFYERGDQDYDGWTVEITPAGGAAWTNPGAGHPWESLVVSPDNEDVQQALFRIALPQNAMPPYSGMPADADTLPAELILSLVKDVSGTPVQDPPDDLSVSIAEDGNTVWVRAGTSDLASTPAFAPAVVVGPAWCHWIYSNSTNGNVIACPPGWTNGDGLYYLVSSSTGDMGIGLNRFTNAEEMFELTPGAALDSPPDNQRNLSGWDTLTLPGDVTAADAKRLAKSQLLVVGQLPGDGLRDATPETQGTELQMPGALDDLYVTNGTANDATLGPDYSGGAPTLRVWAPTATDVKVNIYDTSTDAAPSSTMDLTEDTASGVWSVAGNMGWDRKFYTFSITTFRPDQGDNNSRLGEVSTVEVTDPYSVSLSTNSTRSQFVNLADASLKPADWDTLTLPALAAPEDIAIYELHIRDFSIADSTVPEADRGRYTAFAQTGTEGISSLESLADAGLTHVHMLPSFDIATINEVASERIEIDSLVDDLCAADADADALLCPTYNGMTIREVMESESATSDLQQEITEIMADLDGFNWGYDPFHFNVPEGSYSTDPDGAQRILEYREMVAALSGAGLRTVMDVVYNHTNREGLDLKSVLDKVVPYYYHRRNEFTGEVERSTCCSNTAPEFAMMGKLVVDSTAQFVEQYKIGGFRFDLMGHHPKQNILDVYNTTKAIDSSVYIYGEGWNFGEVESNRRFEQATQANMAGTGIGTFNDRIRDGVRGGGPFDGGIAHVQNQGYISGLFYDPNAENTGSSEEREDLLQLADWIRVGLAGNLASITFEDSSGNVVRGSEIDYNGQPTGYTEDPQETINYISSHDNETLWDISQYKHPAGTLADVRVRAHNLGQSVIALGQGVRFFHAGSDLLRSKSVDRDSFNSGDWFNEIDWTRLTQNWKIGLPVQNKNLNNWPEIATMFADSTTDTTFANRTRSFEHLQEMLEVRNIHNLLRLPSKDEIVARVQYHNTGEFQVPGLIVQSIDGCISPTFTPDDGGLVVIFNAGKQEQTFRLFPGEDWTLSSVLQNSSDPEMVNAGYDPDAGFTVPARTAAVFRKDQDGAVCNIFAAAETLVRGGFNDWSADDPMTEVGDTSVLQATIDVDTSVTSSYEYKIADETWNVINCGGPEGGSALDVPVDDGADPAETTTLECGANPANLSTTFPMTDDYKFQLDTTDPANPDLRVLAQVGDEFGTTTAFVRGGFNDWGEGNPMELIGSSTYQTTISIDAGQYEFKIAEADWTTINCGGPEGGDSMPVNVGSPTTLSCSKNPVNLSIDIPTTGDYQFSLDAMNTPNPRLTVSVQEGNAWTTTDVFVRGGFNDWGTDNQLESTGGDAYQSIINITSTASFEFKIAAEDWASVNCGGADNMDPVGISTPTTLSCGANPPNLSIDIGGTGSYTFDVDTTNPNNPVLTVTPP